jgi:hypothetical protein
MKKVELEKQASSEIAHVGIQQLIDAGFNAFGLQLFCESFADRAKAEQFRPFRFIFRGLKFTVERVEGEELDTRHH